MNIAGALLPLLAALPAFAQQDPLKSPACGEALAALQDARGREAAAARVEGLRSAAAAICLGSGALPTRPGRILRQPIAVPPPRVELTAPGAPPPAAALPAPPIAVERGPLPAHCDAGGCWSSDGTHLRLLPPGVAGPQGPCMAQGAVVYCP